MLLSGRSCLTTSESRMDSEGGRCCADAGEEVELEGTCRALTACMDDFEPPVGEDVGDLYFPSTLTDPVIRFDTGGWKFLEAGGGSASPVETAADQKQTWWPTDGTAKATDPVHLKPDGQVRMTSFMDLLWEDDDFENRMQDYSSLLHNMDLSIKEGLMDRTASCTDIPVSCENTESLLDLKMQDVNQDFFNTSLLPDDILEFEREVSFDPRTFDELIASLSEQTEISSPPSFPNPGDESKSLSACVPRKPNTKSNRHKRKNLDPKPNADENRKAKRQKTADSDVEPAPIPGETAVVLPSNPQNIVRNYPPRAAAPVPVQFITLPDSPEYRLVGVSSPPPVIRLPLPNTTNRPMYILVPVESSPPCQLQIPPMSPVGGSVAPVLTSSPPLGSLSDTVSKVVSPSCAIPLSPSYERSPTRVPSSSPLAPTESHNVQDCIRRSKAQMMQMCLEMEDGLSLDSHYVNVQVSQREMSCSGKSPNKCPGKELVSAGDTDRQNNMMELSKIFQTPNGRKTKRCVLLLGSAGTGKTTLIKKLCLDWSRNHLPEFDFVFLLDGKSMTLTQPVYSLPTLLLGPNCIDPEVAYAQFLATPKRVLIIFDGFDELRDFESLFQTQEKECVASLQKDCTARTFTVKQLYAAILQRLLLPGCTLLLSTRPRGTASQLLRRVDTLLEAGGFTPENIETYLNQYITNATLRKSSLELLQSSSYLHRLCWNPGLCRLACIVLKLCRNPEDVPTTLTGLCHRVVCGKLEKATGSASTQQETQKETSTQSEQYSPVDVLQSPRGMRCGRRKVAKRTKSRRNKKQDNQDDIKQCEDTGDGGHKDLLGQLAALAWEGVKVGSSIIPVNRVTSAKVKTLGVEMGLLQGQNTGILISGRWTERSEEKDEDDDIFQDQSLVWANPFLQSYMAAVHLSLLRGIQVRAFIQTLPFQTGARCRRRPKREELELTQRIAVGLLFCKRSELKRLHSCLDATSMSWRQTQVEKHLQKLLYPDLNPTQVLELCHYVYEATLTQDTSGSLELANHMAENLPESLTLNGVPLSPPDVFVMLNALRWGAAEGRSFNLDLENTGIQISDLRALVSLDNINSFRGCIADIINLWIQLEQSGQDSLLQNAVSKFRIHPLKATKVCHIEQLQQLVEIHVNKRLQGNSSPSHSILTEGVPAVKELLQLELELGPEISSLALPKLWDLLPGLNNLQHLDLENNKIGDKGAEELGGVLHSLTSLEKLNLSQNCIGDHGMKNLALRLKDLPKLHCLSLCGNEISDEGAESLAAVLPHMASLTHLYVEFNKLRDVGAQSLGHSLRSCGKIKTLRMWNQCIPLGVFEKLQQQDSRILS